MNINDYIEITDSHFIVEMMYAGTRNNMCGRPIYQEIGFGNHAYLHRDMWNILQKAIPYLESQHLKLKIFDAARPVIAHQKMLEIIPIKGFFALDPQKSQHCHATAIDVCLCHEDGTELAYPTKVDAYDSKIASEIQQGNTFHLTEHLQKARHDYQAPHLEHQIANRKQLKQLMESIGLLSIPHEWWHYNLPNGLDYPLFEIGSK